MARTAARWAAVVALALCLGACGGDDEPEGTSPTTTEPTTTESTTTTEPELTDEEAVTQLVEEWSEVRTEAVLNGEIPLDQVERYLTPSAAEQFTDEMAQRAAEGIETRRPDPDPTSWEIVSATVEGETASVVECVVDGLVQYKPDTGEVVDDSVGTFVRSLSLVEVEDDWRIDEIKIREQFQGVQPCPDE